MYILSIDFAAVGKIFLLKEYFMITLSRLPIITIYDINNESIRS